MNSIIIIMNIVVKYFTREGKKLSCLKKEKLNWRIMWPGKGENYVFFINIKINIYVSVAE